MPAPPGSGSVERERDAWVQAIDKLCSEWRRRSMGEQAFVGPQTLRTISIEEEEEEAEEPESTGWQSNGGLGGDVYPPVNREAADDQISAEAGSDASGGKPVSKARRKLSAPDVRPDDSLTVSTPVPPTSPQPPATTPPPPSISPPPSPAHAASTSSTTVQRSLSQDSGPAAVKVPLPPAPPPLPLKWNSSSKKKHTRPFHWDVVTPDKVNSYIHPSIFYRL